MKTDRLDGERVLEKLKRLDRDAESVKIDLSKGNVLEKGKIYVVPLLETVNLRLVASTT